MISLDEPLCVSMGVWSHSVQPQDTTRVSDNIKGVCMRLVNKLQVTYLESHTSSSSIKCFISPEGPTSSAVLCSNPTPNQKFSWEHSRIKVGRLAMPRQIFVGKPPSLSWAHVWHMSRLLREAAHNIKLSLVGQSHF